ncbi:MAG: sphingosine kinase [Aquiluna sp.]|nr:sphingosine kinase [Aquiluna sp.]MCF8546127.1 sphingosine kinase [Aquiluna sp.]
MKPLGVLVNPQANRGRGNIVGDKVFELLAKAGIPAINLSADSALHAKEKSQIAISDQEISGVIAIGGDGTAQLGVNICVPNQLPLGIVPAGSGNDQARELNIPLQDIPAAVSNILESLDSPRRVDVMKVTTGEREFWSLGSISAGFDALCAQRANGLKWPKGPNSYIASLLLELPRFRPIDYHLVVDGEHRDVTAMLCGVANVKNFGGGMRISPQSEITDGELEVFILHKVSRPKLLQIFPTVYKGEHINYEEVEIFKAKSIRIENNGFPMTCDGELIGPAPFSTEIHPGALQVFSR